MDTNMDRIKAISKKLMGYFSNPYKCEILVTIQQQGRTTAKQVMEQCKNIPQATLYRYLKAMEKDGIIQVLEEKRVRGVVEKVYGPGEILKGDEIQKALENNSGEVYMLLLLQYMHSIVSEFYEYTKQENIDLQKDGSGFSIGPIYGNDEEIMEAMQEISVIVERLRNNGPGEGRKMRSIGLILTPPKKAGK